MAESSIDTVFPSGLLAEVESLVIGFVHDSYVYEGEKLKLEDVDKAKDENAKYLPLDSRDAKNPSWPDANAGWMFGVPPSVPSLSLLYLRNRNIS